jgi:tRNA (guanine9-N1)-methyltransferase
MTNENSSEDVKVCGIIEGAPRHDSPSDALPGIAAPPKISKNQLKKKRRLERMMEVKKRRKLQDKEAKEAKAQAEGRNLDEVRRDEAERRLVGIGRKRRQEEWEKRERLARESSFRVCLDCSFEKDMTGKEIGSLSLQLRYCYGINKSSPHPCLLSATGVGGETLTHLQKVSGFDEWSNRAFSCTERSLEDYYRDNISQIVYLTSDSQNVLEDLDNEKIYIIGGIVDRNRLRRAAIDRAERLGVATARLPLDKHLKEMASTRVLTCNHVFEILIKFREHGKSWKKALHDVLPQRKEAKLMDGEDREAIEVKEIK